MDRKPGLARLLPWLYGAPLTSVLLEVLRPVPSAPLAPEDVAVLTASAMPSVLRRALRSACVAIVTYFLCGLWVALMVPAGVYLAA